MLLVEHLSWDEARLQLQRESGAGGSPLRLHGLMLQGNTTNHNNRIYPAEEIRRAVDTIRAEIRQGRSVLGELDHPDPQEFAKIHLDRVSHVIEDMWMEGDHGHGRLRLLDRTPMGQICRALLEEDVRLGVSSRGDGDLTWDPARNCYRVSNFRILTVDIVARPSAPDAYPKVMAGAARPVAETLEHRRSALIEDLAQAAVHDPRARRFLRREIRRWVEAAFDRQM